MRYITLLAGSTGVGKSSSIKLIGDALNWKVHQIPIRASWRDPEQLFGYLNPIKPDQFVPSALLDAVYSARLDWKMAINKSKSSSAMNGSHGRIHVIILEEIGMANPDHYLADLLQLFDPGRNIKKWNDRECQIRLYSELHRCHPIPPFVSIPPNIIFVGTANYGQIETNISQMFLSRSAFVHAPRKKNLLGLIDDVWPPKPQVNPKIIANWENTCSAIAIDKIETIELPRTLPLSKDERRNKVASLIYSLLKQSSTDGGNDAAQARSLAYSYSSMTHGFDHNTNDAAEIRKFIEKKEKSTDAIETALRTTLKNLLSTAQ